MFYFDKGKTFKTGKHKNSGEDKMNKREFLEIKENTFIDINTVTSIYINTLLY